MLPFAFLPSLGGWEMIHRRHGMPADLRKPPAERHALAGQERDRVQERRLRDRGRARSGGDRRQENSADCLMVHAVSISRDGLRSYCEFEGSARSFV